jgi:DNA-binding beta-propeller fold protein YncE
MAEMVESRRQLCTESGHSCQRVAYATKGSERGLIMRLVIALAAVAAASCAPLALRHLPTEPLVLKAPGHLDFLAVDGATVWATNQSRLEHWSTKGRLASVQLAEPCGAMVVHSKFVWVADCKEKAVYKIDVRTAETVAVVHTGLASPDGETNVVAGGGSIWVPSDTSGRIARINPSSHRVIASVSVDPGTHYLAFGMDSLWAVSSSKQSLQQINPKTNTVVRRISLGRGPGFLAAGEGAVWVQEQLDGTVARIDPGTGKVTGRVKVGNSLKWGDIDTGGGRVWLRTTDDQTYAIIDPRTLAITARVANASGSGAIRYAGNGVWTSEHDLETLTWWDFGRPH